MQPVMSKFKKFTPSRIAFFQERIDRINNNKELSAEEKLVKLNKILDKQQEILQSVVTEETSVFSHVEQLLSYKKLAERGLSFMAGSHEVCGLFMKLQYFFKNNEEGQPYLQEINRLEEIFKGQLHSSSSMGKYTGESLAEHYQNLYSRRTKELIFTDSFKTLARGENIWVRNNVMHLILSNLISNAISFAESKVVVDLVDSKIVVSDDGKGISKDFENKLFNVGHSQKRNGHGIGLFICRESAREEGCELSFDKDNKHTNLSGASFIFEVKMF